MPTQESLELTAEVQFSDAPQSSEELASETRKRRFEAVAYTGAVVDRVYGPMVIDVDGIEPRDRVPMLVDHDGTKIAGYADQMTKDNTGQLLLSGVLSSTTDEGKRVAGLSDEGFPWQMSIGIAVLEREDFGAEEVCTVNGEEIQGPITCIRASRLRECSFLYSGADRMTSGVALGDETTDQESEQMASSIEMRGELLAFLGEFPGEESLAALRFAEGKTLAEVRLEIAEKSLEELGEVREQLARVTQERDAALEQLETLKALELEAGSPGVAFNAPVREKGPQEVLGESPQPNTYDEAWEQFEELRAEFGDRASFDAYCRATRPAIKELVKWRR